MAVPLVVVVYFVLVENAYRAYVVELREAAHYHLFGGLHSVLFWFGLILGGCFLPMIILFRKTGKSVRRVLVCSGLVLFGFIGFLFVWGLKVFPLMPTEAPAFKRVVVVEPPVVKKASVSAT